MFSNLSHGGCLCKFCYPFAIDKSFRFKHFLAVSGSVTFPDRKAISAILLNPPIDPWAIYITQSRKKQGWLSGIRKINFSRDNYYVMTDFAGIFFTSRKVMRELHDLAVFLRLKKVGKTAMLSGEFLPCVYRTAIEEGWKHKLDEAKRHKGQPEWEVIVYVVE